MLLCCSVALLLRDGGSIVVLILYNLQDRFSLGQNPVLGLILKTKGELSLRKIVNALYEWTERRMADAAYNESKADEML